MDGGVFGDKAAEGYQGWVLNARWYCILLCKNFCLNLAIALQTDYNNRMGKVYIPSFYYPLWSMRTLFKLLTYVASVFTSVTGQDFFHWRHFFCCKKCWFRFDIVYLYRAVILLHYSATVTHYLFKGKSVVFKAMKESFEHN